MCPIHKYFMTQCHCKSHMPPSWCVLGCGLCFPFVERAAVSFIWEMCEQALRTFALIIIGIHICLSFNKWELYVLGKAPWLSIIVKHVSISLGFCSTLSEKNNKILFSLDVGQIVSKISHRMMTSFVTRETMFLKKFCLKSIYGALHSKCAICVFHY